LDIGGAAGAPNNRDPSVAFLKPLLDGKATPEQMADLMKTNMVDMAYNGGAQFAIVLRRLITSDQPLLYHCTAGKDRTGMATAFLLSILGAKKEIIEADYLLINKLMPPDQTAPAMAKRPEAVIGAPLNPELVKPLLGTRIEWLHAASEGINRRSGSFDNYRREVLGFSDEDAAVLKLRLLEN
jgi:protein-tyrosine phosphatase